MNLDKLKVINKTNTSNTIFKWLAGCNPISSTTNLITFKEFLEKKFELSEQDFYNVFDSLEEAEIGFFSSAQPNIFHWEYNITDVVTTALHPNKKVNIRKYEEIMERKPKKKLIQPASTPLTFNLKEVLNVPQKLMEQPEKAPEPESKQVMIKKHRGRPPGAKNKIAPKTKKPVIGDTVSNPLNREVIFFFTTRRGTKIPFRLDDVEDLVAQAKEIQAVI